MTYGHGKNCAKTLEANLMLFERFDIVLCPRAFRAAHRRAMLHRIVRKGGRLLREMEKNSGGRPSKNLTQDALGYPPTLTQLGFEDTAAMRWQRVAQLPQADYDTFKETWNKETGQRAATAVVSRCFSIAVDILPALEAEAREREKRGRELDPSQKIEQGKSTELAAQIVGTNRQYVSDAKRIKQEAPKLFEQIRNGELSITQARREFIRVVTPEPPPFPTGKFRVILADPPWRCTHMDVGVKLDAMNVDATKTLHPGGRGCKVSCRQMP